MRVELLSLLAGAALLLAAAGAAAQTPAQTAARRVLLEQAQQARVAGDHARALELAERAGAIEMTPSVRMFIADEQMALGRLAAAFGSADSCAREAERGTTIPNRDTILAHCREVFRQLRPRVGYVTVHVPAPRPAGLRVVVAGEELPAVLFDAPSVVTPGAVVVEASADGRAPFRRVATVAAGQTADVQVELAPGAADVAVSAPPAGGPGASVVVSGDAHDAGASGPSDRARGGFGPPGVGPLVVMGLGVVGLGLAPVFLALRDDAAGRCTVRSDAIACPDDASADQARAAPGFNTGMYASLAAGGALLAGGVVWWLVTPRAAPSRARTMLQVAPTDGGVVLGFGRRF